MRALLAFLIFLLTPAITHAVHECGTSHTDGATAQGCSHLKESDFFYGDPRADAPELASGASLG